MNYPPVTPLFSLFLNSRKDIMRIQVPRAFRIYLHYMTAYLMFDFRSRLFLMSEIHWRSFLCLLLLISNCYRSHEFVIITFSVLKFVILDFQNLRFLYELMTSVIDIYPGAILELVFLVFFSSLQYTLQAYRLKSQTWFY